jgi:hypothetical protein
MPVLKPGLKPAILYSGHSHSSEKGIPVKTTLSKLFLFAQKINRQHIQIAFALLALVLFVLGAGAPDAGAPVGPR